MLCSVVQVTGEDYAPGKSPSAATAPAPAAPQASVQGSDIRAQVEAQGNKVRDLKAAKAAKDVVQAAVKDLLDLKAKYKEVTGEDYVPGPAKPAAAAPASTPTPAPVVASKEDEIREQVDKQGSKVRDLKSAKASKDVIQAEVKTLLDLKAKFKEVEFFLCSAL